MNQIKDIGAEVIPLRRENTGPRNWSAEIEALRLELGRPSTAWAGAGMAGVSERVRRAKEWDIANPEGAQRFQALLREADAAERAEQALADERERAERRLRKFDAAIERSGIGPRSNDVAKAPEDTEALGVVRRWLAEKDLAWLALCGAKGTGKSVAATWAIREALRAGQSAAFRRTSELATLSQFDAGATELEALRRVDLLALDDFGAELLTDYAKAQLFSLLDYRHENYGRTILTSNLQWQGAGGMKERLGERIVDRLSQCGRVQQLAATKSMRRGM